MNRMPRVQSPILWQPDSGTEDWRGIPIARVIALTDFTSPSAAAGTIMPDSKTGGSIPPKLEPRVPV